MDSDGGSSFKYGHQEDAEEFFSSLLNAVHDEMVDITNEVNDRIQGMCAVVCVLTLGSKIILPSKQNCHT